MIGKIQDESFGLLEKLELKIVEPSENWEEKPRTIRKNFGMKNLGVWKNSDKNRQILEKFQ